MIEFDRQDESLTGQIHNQSGHCPLTGPYFEPCCNILIFYFLFFNVYLLIVSTNIS